MLLKRLFRFEHHRERLATPRQFLGRLAINLGAAGVLIGASLIIGMTGYHLLEGMGLVDSYLNAAMILSGMGPEDPMHTDAGKVFAGSYALFSGIVLVLSSGVILAPVLHRVLHSMHISEEDGEPSKRRP